jgi:hypothetical protein
MIGADTIGVMPFFGLYNFSLKDFFTLAARKLKSSMVLSFAE